MVPSWLIGTWNRTYIRRRRAGTDVLGDSDSTVSVTYVQTPWAFVDVRSKVVSEGTEKPMAFAGVTVVDESQSPPLVKWHACIDMDDAEMDCRSLWNRAEDGQPKPTEDVGHFQKMPKEGEHDVYHEYDPDRTLLEQWVRIDDGQNKYFAARDETDGTMLLVVAGSNFGFCSQKDKVFVAGVVRDAIYANKTNWVIETSANDSYQKGDVLNIPAASWKVLRGSTLTLEGIGVLA